MAYARVLTAPPKRITAGESLSWSAFFADFPAGDGWSLRYTLVAAGEKITIDASADADAFLVEVAATDAAAYVAGKYQYQAHVSKGEERYKVDSGAIEIVADFATLAEGVDSRPWIDRAIEALEAAIVGRAGKTQLMQTVGGVQVQHMALDTQLSVLTRLKRIRAGRRALANLGTPIGAKL